MKSVARTISAAPRKASPGSRYKVPNLERGLMILEHLMDFPQGLQQSEITAQLRYSKTSVFRVTMTLLEFGYLVRDSETKALRLSRKLLAMGNRALGEDNLIALACDRPVATDVPFYDWDDATGIADLIEKRFLSRKA